MKEYGGRKEGLAYPRNVLSLVRKIQKYHQNDITLSGDSFFRGIVSDALKAFRYNEDKIFNCPRLLSTEDFCAIAYLENLVKAARIE